MLLMLSNMATILFFVTVYVYVAAEVMIGGGKTAELAWQVLVPSIGAAIGLRVLAWLFAPRASVNRRREQMQKLLRARH